MHKETNLKELALCTYIHASYIYVTGHEKIGLMCTQNLTSFWGFKLE